MPLRSSLLAALGFVLLASTISAQTVQPRAQSMIHGTAVDASGNPLPSAPVRLRNLQTNQVERVSSANRSGEFTFVAQPEIPYVVEIVDRAGKIIAVGDVVVAQAGEVAGTIVAIPTRLPALAGVFGPTAGAVISAAAGLGLTALEATASPEPLLPPASPEQ